MRRGLPRTPFSTPFSLSKRMVEVRIRGLIAGPQKRPPLPLLALVLTFCFFSVNLVSCQPAQPEENPYFDQYHSQLAAAQGMRRNNPMLHNNRIITDGGQLEQARKLLALEPLTEEEASRPWDGDWTTSISFTSALPAPDWTGTDDGSPSYYVSYGEEGWWYILLPAEREEDERPSGVYLGKLSAENWALADELFESAPTVDDRLHAAGWAGYAYRVIGGEYPEALAALTQLFVNDELFLSQNAQVHDSTPEDIAAWLSGKGSDPIAPEVYVISLDPWTLSAFGDGSLLFWDLTIPDRLTSQIEDICQSFGITPTD